MNRCPEEIGDMLRETARQQRQKALCFLYGLIAGMILGVALAFLGMVLTS